ncbi:hypothetical protein NDU88_001719 [Pleurodeles waltl]|uniref:Uncharacterized protein n=1 Tax=Pleurodeles waltl TaxID=8319 RepID=A0AAV7Q4N5_PLEWA|nr:hypothetical protein NDU88_001719 [Pleurodeles waltl]
MQNSHFKWIIVVFVSCEFPRDLGDLGERRLERSGPEGAASGARPAPGVLCPEHRPPSDPSVGVLVTGRGGLWGSGSLRLSPLLATDRTTLGPPQPLRDTAQSPPASPSRVQPSAAPSSSSSRAVQDLRAMVSAHRGSDLFSRCCSCFSCSLQLRSQEYKYLKYRRGSGGSAPCPHSGSGAPLHPPTDGPGQASIRRLLLRPPGCRDCRASTEPGLQVS